MKSKQGRFNYYDVFADLGEPEAVGLFAGEKDFDYGTPNLERQEDVTLVAANASMQQCLLARFKWRPTGDGRLVTLISRLSLVLEGAAYEFEQIETYRPSESRLRSGRFTQYGSSSSKLKLFVTQPYRRARLLFNGHLVRVDGGGGASPTVFVKLSCVLSTLTANFDFLGQYDESCLSQIHAAKKLAQPLNQVVTNLLLHDRHEHKVRLAGEYLLIDHHRKPAESGGGGQEGARKVHTFALFGFHARHFSSAALGGGGDDNDEHNIVTRRLFGYMNNGQAFHLATRKRDLSEIDLGYTSFMIYPKMEPIDKPFKLDWSQLEPAEGGQKFELELSGQTLTFEGRGERRQGDWYKLETNGKPGWAWFSRDDQLPSSPAELQAIATSRSERELAISSGRLIENATGGGRGDSSSAELVVSIEEDSCSNSQLVGSKAASLAQLTKFAARDPTAAAAAQYKVPAAFVLTRHAHDLLLETNPGLREQIDLLQQFVGQGEQLDGLLRERCKMVADFVSERATLPDQIRLDLWAKLTNVYGVQRPQGDQLTFAVRSSAWGEDEDDMSAAGQLSTLLHVKFEPSELARAITTCFASKFSYENVQYKRLHGLPLDLPMAVVVQEMVACEKAGVMFTCDPTTGDESRITITANFGLGESVVSAQADPDSIQVRTGKRGVATVSRPTLYGDGDDDDDERSLVEIENISVGQKKVVISSGGGGGDQNQPDQLDQLDKSQCCLSEAQILRLARCGLSVSRLFGFQRRDIEWGYLGEQLFLFQARPVTGLEGYTQEELMCETDRPSQAELGYFTRANIGEVMPYAIRPLTLTFSALMWNIAGGRFFVSHCDEDLYAPQCPAEVFHYKYHSFFNLRCSMLLPLSDAQRSVLSKSMEIGMFGREMGVQPELVEASKGFVQKRNPFQGRRYSLMTLPLKWMPNRVIMREKAVMDKLRGEVRALRLATGYEQNKLLGLYNQLRVLSRHLYNCWTNHINIIMLATNNNMILTAVLSKYIQDPLRLSAATNKFLAISPDVISAEIPERVAAMAKLIQARGLPAIQEFVSMSDAEALAYLRSEAAENKPLSQSFGEFLERFGHRCYNEFELAELAWRERPELVVEMIRMNCRARCQPTGAGLQEAEEPPLTIAGEQQLAVPTSPQGQKPRTIDEVIKSLDIEPSFKDRMLIKHMLAPKCQQSLAMREKTKSVLVMHTDVLREASRLLAAEMQRQLRIPDQDLFYYMMFDELAPLVRDHQPAIVCQAIRRRQMFTQSFSVMWKYDEIISDITPNHLRPNKAVDEALARAPKLFGTPASSGKVRGKICLVNNYKELDRVRAGHILLTHSTDIAFSPVFPLISGIITEVGGSISHGAVVAREYGLPSVIGIPDVMRILKDGEEIILDADNGAIVRLGQAQP